MPNHVEHNFKVFEGGEELRKFFDADGKLSFDKIIPMPKELAITSCYDFNYTNDQLQFNTAWSIPEPILKKLAELIPTLHMAGTAVDEDDNFTCIWIEAGIVKFIYN